MTEGRQADTYPSASWAQRALCVEWSLMLRPAPVMKPWVNMVQKESWENVPVPEFRYIKVLPATFCSIIAKKSSWHIIMMLHFVCIWLNFCRSLSTTTFWLRGIRWPWHFSCLSYTEGGKPPSDLQRHIYQGLYQCSYTFLITYVWIRCGLYSC